MRPFWTLIPQEEERLTQGTKDAMADAATLDAIAGLRASYPRALWKARQLGQSAAFCLTGHLEGDAAWYARVAAHVAFRAIPGLRG